MARTKNPTETPTDPLDAMLDMKSRSSDIALAFHTRAEDWF